MSNFINCRPPGAAGQNPFTWANFQTRTMYAAVDGTAVATLFPLLRRMATIDLIANAGISGITLSSSLINETPGDTVAVFVGIDRGPLISVDGSFEFFVSHLTLQNSTAGSRNASSRSNAIAMGDNSAYKLNSGQKIALYLCSDNALGNEISATATVYWNPLPNG